MLWLPWSLLMLVTTATNHFRQYCNVLEITASSFHFSSRLPPELIHIWCWSWNIQTCLRPLWIFCILTEGFMKCLRLKREQEGPFFLLHNNIAKVTQNRNARLTSLFKTSVRQHQAWKKPFHCTCGQLVDSFLITPFQAEQLSIACPRSVNA